MKTMMKRLIAGGTLAVLAGSLDACAPVVVASRPHPHPVIVDPVPVAVAPEPVVMPVVMAPVVPVWAPPYAYVNEVHYYYFPDYMVYYDVFGSTYCYYNGYSWLHVAVLPVLPVYYGFNPYTSYIVVLNRSCYDPWMRNSYYTNLYPSGYYQATYAPRTSLGSNTVLRAFDENQNRPLFVDKRSNKEVPVKYDVKQGPRTAISTDNARKSGLNTQDVRQTTDRNATVRSSEQASPLRQENSRNEVKQNTRSQSSETMIPSSGRRNELQDTRTDSRKNNKTNMVAADQQQDRNVTVPRYQNAVSPEKNNRAGKSPESSRTNTASEKTRTKEDIRESRKSAEHVNRSSAEQKTAASSDDFRMEKRSEPENQTSQKVRRSR